MAAQFSDVPTMDENIKIAANAVVCKECELKGDITIGSRTIIHPRARIVAENGPIIIGENNLIEEQAQIINRFPMVQTSTVPMVIGSHNVFEVGSLCEALKVGDYNVLEAKAKVGRQTELTNGCIVGAMCEVVSEEIIPENTVIYGRKCERRIQGERPAPQTLQLDFLSKFLPNYHHLKKTSKVVK